MDFLQAIFLGVLQGITEFLPISSSAHLIITSKLLNWADQGLIFDLSVHFGSLIAVMIYFRQQSIQLIYGSLDLIINKKTQNSTLVKKLIIATIPIIITGFALKNFVEDDLRNYVWIIGFSSIFWGIVLYIADKKEQIHAKKQFCYKTAFLMGLAQAIAIIPGTSRSGITITMARFFKFSRVQAAQFSMLMSIPVILLMTIVKLFEIDQNILNELHYLILGTFSSFIAALLTIKTLLKFVNKVGFLPFVIYRIFLGIIIFIII